MARIIAIDYGLKRTGLAWTDPLQIIASGLETVLTKELEAKLEALVRREEVEAFVLGMPTNLDGEDTHTTQPVLKFKQRLEKLFPDREVILWDEQFTSKMAMRAMIEAGVPKKKRRNKALVDQVSATIILQDYLANS
ncbi:MAG: Holliday junction resolvase RuvX [Bacteroidota bacterium]